jgi:ribosomal-protein-alanine N-acetyltransferase
LQHNEVYGLLDTASMIGFMCFSDHIDWLELLNIAVKTPKQGHGRLLLTALLKLAQKRQRPRVLLEVRASNLGAQALYYACGFQLIHRRANYYPTQENKREDALIMECKVC